MCNTWHSSINYVCNYLLISAFPTLNTDRLHEDRDLLTAFSRTWEWAQGPAQG